MKKVTIIEIAVLIIFIIAVIIFLAPYFIKEKQDMIISRIKASNAIFISKTIEEFAKDKNAKPSDISKKVIDILNETEKNPYGTKDAFYVAYKDCTGCTKVESDDNLRMVIITTFNKEGELVARTVINPPSYVTYYKENKD